VNLFLTCIPPRVSHHAKRIGRRGKFARLADKAELTAARGDLISMLMAFAPPTPLDCPLRLQLTYFWPYLSSDRRVLIQNKIPIPQITKPDCDNIAKTLIDCLVRCGFLVNDSRIWWLEVAKYRWHTPGILILLEERHGERSEVLAARYRAARKDGDPRLADSAPDHALEGSGDGSLEQDELGAGGRAGVGGEIGPGLIGLEPVTCGRCGKPADHVVGGRFCG
jgi:Holliday junction resolvase RusA-like endonuclease